MWEGENPFSNILNLLFVVTSFLRRHNIFFPSFLKKIIWTNLRKAGFNVSQPVSKQTKIPANSYPQGEGPASPREHDSCRRAYTPEMQDGPLSATYGVHTPERGCLRRLPGPRLTVTGGSMKGNKSRRWVRSHTHCALHGKSLLAAALYVNNCVCLIWLLLSRSLRD